MRRKSCRNEIFGGINNFEKINYNLAVPKNPRLA